MPLDFKNFSAAISFLMGLVLLAFLPDVVVADGPQNVLLVVNEDSPESLAVANHYIKLRDIPPRNVVYLKGVAASPKDGGESISARFFQTQIFEPIHAAISERKLDRQIDCIT